MKNLFLGKLGFKTCVLKKHFISYSCIFISYLPCFEVCLQKSGYFSKKMFFQIFDWSNLFFDQLKSFLKILECLCLVRLIETVFRSIEHCESGFLKHGSWLFQKFFLSFSNLFLSLRLSKAPQRIFCRFPSNFLQGFSLRKPVCLYYPPFALFFSFSCIISWFLSNFRTMLNLGFLINQVL